MVKRVLVTDSPEQEKENARICDPMKLNSADKTAVQEAPISISSTPDCQSIEEVSNPAGSPLSPSKGGPKAELLHSDSEKQKDSCNRSIGDVKEPTSSKERCETSLIKVEENKAADEVDDMAPPKKVRKVNEGEPLAAPGGLVQMTLFGGQAIRSPPERPASPGLRASPGARAEREANDAMARPLAKDDQGSADIEQANFNPGLCGPEVWASFVMKGKEKVYKHNQMLFEPVANAWARLEQLKHSGAGSRQKAILLLGNLYRLILYHCPHELVYAAYMTLHRVAPDYFGIEIGVGDAMLIRTISEVYGRKEASVKTELQQSGDLGSVAMQSKLSTSLLMTPPRLSLRVVYDELRAVSEAKGANAQQRKREKIKKLLVAAVGEEPKFIIRFLEKRLGIGIKSAAVLDAMAMAFVMTPPDVDKNPTPPEKLKDSLLEAQLSDDFSNFFSKYECISDVRHRKSPPTQDQLSASLQKMELAIRTAYSQVPNLFYVMYFLLIGSDADKLLKRCVICPGIPVLPMLAKPTKSLSEVLDAMAGEEFQAEYKYDGERVQIHKLKNGVVNLFSRNLEVMDFKYPDVKEVAIEAINKNTVDFILDSEVVAFNSETQEILPFQTLSGRKRKDVDAKTVVIHVCLFVFDCLRFNGESLVSTSLKHRRECLKKAVHEIPNKLHFARGGTVTDTTELEALLQEAIDHRTEGLMVKVLEGERSYYEPSKRSVNWLKLKKDYLDNLGDSVDLVPIGAFWGRGRRVGTYGGYLLAVYDEDEEVFRSVCKVATGFTDDDLVNHYNFYQDKIIQKKPEYYHLNEKMEPEVWFDACQVWECKAADLSISPVHTAGWGAKAKDRGIALRFPRYLKIRDDKKPEQATCSKQIVDMYDAQFKGGAAKEILHDDDDDLLF